MHSFCLIGFLQSEINISLPFFIIDKSSSKASVHGNNKSIEQSPTKSQHELQLTHQLPQSNTHNHASFEPLLPASHSSHQSKIVVVDVPLASQEPDSDGK